MRRARHLTVVRGLSAVALMGLLLAPAVPAAGAAPTVERTEAVFVQCAVQVGEALVEVDARLYEVGGETGVEVFVSTPTEFIAPDFAQQADVVVEPSSVSASIPMLRYPAGEPAGVALVELAFEPVGEPEVIEERVDSAENVRSRTTGTSQPLSVTGSVSVAGLTVTDLSGCQAERVDITSRQTNPDTVVSGLGGGWSYDAHCVVDQGDGFLDLIVEGKESVGSFEVVTTDGVFEGSILDGDRHPGVLTATYDVTVDGTSVGTASTRITAGDLIGEDVTLDTLGPFRRMVHVKAFDASGELTLPDGSVIPLACELFETSGYAILHSPSGPTPSNDLPQDALPLAAGQQVQARTSGAAREPEVGNQCAEEGLTHTVWYTFTGTGDDVTLDTAGSDFDTVIDVYVLGPDGEPVGVGCADYAEDGNRLARLTLPTIEGATYLVQVGGSGGQSGRLTLTRSP
jgi:hypothetical protein